MKNHIKKLLLALFGVATLAACQTYVPEGSPPPALQPGYSLTVIMRVNDGWRERCMFQYTGTPNMVPGNTINSSWSTTPVAVCQNATGYTG